MNKKRSRHTGEYSAMKRMILHKGSDIKIGNTLYRAIRHKQTGNAQLVRVPAWAPNRNDWSNY